MSPFLSGPVEPPSIKGIYYRRARKVGALDASRTADLKKEMLVNVGGRRYLLPWSTLDEFPLSRLSKLRFCRSHEEIAQLCDDYDEDNQEFFFDRSPSAFGVIVSFLAAGKLVLLREMCVLSFQEELTYWGIAEASLEKCCLRTLLRKRAELAELRREEALQRQREAGQPAVHASRWGLFRSRLRETVENPQSGLPGKVFACLSILFVATTAVSLCVSTMPDLRAEEDKVSGPSLRQARVPGAVGLGAHENVFMSFQTRRPEMNMVPCGLCSVSDQGSCKRYFIHFLVSEKETHEGDP